MQVQITVTFVPPITGEDELRAVLMNDTQFVSTGSIGQQGRREILAIKQIDLVILAGIVLSRVHQKK